MKKCDKRIELINRVKNLNEEDCKKLKYFLQQLEEKIKSIRRIFLNEFRRIIGFYVSGKGSKKGFCLIDRKMGNIEIHYVSPVFRCGTGSVLYQDEFVLCRACVFHDCNASCGNVGSNRK